jgi:Right handed beta helix region
MRNFESLKFCRIALALLSCAFMHVTLTEASVIKITQAKAQAGAVTPGDAPGFPVTITRSGSYWLDGNLTVPVDKDGIVITASQVTINLMGFTIQGSGGIHGSGISATNGPSSITVTNGFITGMGDQGIFITGSNSRIERITVHGNANSGLHLGSRSTVIRSNSSDNGSIGISVGKNSLIADNVIAENGLDGIHIVGGTVARNTIAENGERGIVVLGNNVLSISNTIERNDGLGMQFGPNQGGGYRDNVINNNLGGSVFGGKNMGGNLCNQNITCP